MLTEGRSSAVPTVSVDDIRSSVPTTKALKTFAVGIGCPAIVAALIYTTQQKKEQPASPGQKAAQGPTLGE
jgi:hypothetical protein